MLEIEEVLRRSTQGMTKPYICITEDRNTVFVKGLSAMRQGQINEWICGNLARRFGLPIPDFEIVNVPAELMKINTDVDLSELGIGPAFLKVSKRHLKTLKMKNFGIGNDSKNTL